MVHKHGAYYFLRYDPASRRVTWLRLSDTYPDALRAYADHVERPARFSTLGAIIDQYLAEIAPRKAPATYAGNVREARGLRAFFGRMRPDAIEPQHVYQYMDIRGARAPVRANRERALLSAVFSFAIRLGGCSTNPVQHVKRFRERPRTQAPTEAEIAALCRHGPPWLAPYCAIKILTGMRQADLLALTMAQAAPDADALAFTERKTGKRREILISPALRAALDAALALPRPGRSAALFATRRGGHYSGDGFRSIWSRAMRAAIAADAVPVRFTEHDIRATAATVGKAAGVDVQALLGHTSERQTADYIRHRAPLRAKPVR